MCYSAMVEQSYKILAKRFGAEVDLDGYENLFSRRLDGEKLTLPRAMEAAFTSNPKNRQEKAIATLIKRWHQEQIHVREAELFKQTKRLADAERKLKDKETKKALNDQRIASQKIPWLKDKIKWHKLTKVTDADSRIFPQHYLSMVYSDTDGQLIVGPFRYHLRPAWADASWDRKRDGSYNARRDSLKKAWRNQLGTKHGIILVKRFWENVSPNKYKAKPKVNSTLSKKDNIVLEFTPDDGDWMEIPTIYDTWERKGKPTLHSAALITDDPLEEVALTGHDRTPISLAHDAARVWLNPHETDIDTLLAVLDEIKRPFYEHAVAA